MIWVACSLSALGQWNEDFENDWNGGAGWFGNVNAFTSEAGTLRSDNIVLNGAFYISRPIDVKPEMEWLIKVNLKFNTSSVNYTDIHLWSDSADLTNATESYFIRVGNTKDEVALYRVKNASAPLLIVDGRDNVTAGSNNILRLRVLRSIAGEWKLWSKTDADEQWYAEGVYEDRDSLTSGHFGVFVKQSTASFFKKHFYDDLYIGPPIRDTIPPYLQSFKVLADTSLWLTFSEPVSFTGQVDAAFRWATGVTTQEVIFNGSQGYLKVNPKFALMQDYELSIKGLSDTAGNKMHDTLLSFKFELPVEPKWRDVIITEIMADPDPAIQLPVAEYIELYNRSAYPIELDGLILKDPGTTSVLPPYVLRPGEYLILCALGDVPDFKYYGDVLGLAGIPSLNNSSDSIFLLDKAGKTINQVFYTTKWYNDAVKANGGYSLELIDPGWNCRADLNWSASRNVKGGTPGQPNSILGVVSDTLAPQISFIENISTGRIDFKLSEALDTAIVKLDDLIGSYNFNIGSMIYREYPNTILTLYPVDSFAAGIQYELEFIGLKDCSGNVSESVNWDFRIPESAEKEDVIINEVLFNPHTGGTDYVELYNPSEKAIDLSKLQLAVKDTGGFKSKSSISAVPLILNPGGYCLISENSQQVAITYPVNNRAVFMEVSNLPSLSDDKGNLYLITDSEDVLDRMQYSEEMHHPSLNDVEGVSLEKILPNLDGLLSDNWHSASSLSYFGTPGLKNSQYRAEDASSGVRISNPVFSPDGDGYFDVLLIEIESELMGQNMNAVVLDLMGRKVMDLAKGVVLGSEELLSWDGADENRIIKDAGVYMVYIEVWSKDSPIKRYKYPVTLAVSLKD